MKKLCTFLRGVKGAAHKLGDTDATNPTRSGSGFGEDALVASLSFVARLASVTSEKYGAAVRADENEGGFKGVKDVF